MICREPVVISKDFPISVKYAEVAADQACPTPVIGDVQAALKREIANRCAQGECEEVPCVPESPNTLSILRQLGRCRPWRAKRGPVVRGRRRRGRVAGGAEGR
jgi:hypothetical protein